MLAIIRDAGWPIWPLIATSFLALTLIVERLLALRRTRVFPPAVLDDVLGLVQKKRITPDIIDKLDASSPLGRVLATGLRHRHRSRSATQEALEATGHSVAHDLGRHVGAIGTIAAVAPLMGLFGTVVGMIEIFGAYSPVGNDPSTLAKGISVALYNTGFGIFIAIPAMIFYRYLRTRIEDYLHDLEQAAIRLVDTLHDE
ncbi:MotA/TolQ/ExbB proton channel family protein [Pigmentiphaga litoralis]|uniref:MotA/TolQ/ExbB proton channel family protein n=1 Tax=Pigmentiphaga litoralis TaxID=516702 RepID=UPI003B42E157